MNNINDVISGLDNEQAKAAVELHRRAADAGLFTTFSASDKTNYKKAEYRLSKFKKDAPIFVIQVKSGKINVKCKFYNLDKYSDKLLQLNPGTLDKVLGSKQCKGIENGCTVGVDFELNGSSYNLCRHLIFIRELMTDDIPAVWELVKEEITLRNSQGGYK